MTESSRGMALPLSLSLYASIEYDEIYQSKGFHNDCEERRELLVSFVTLLIPAFRLKEMERM